MAESDMTEVRTCETCSWLEFTCAMSRLVRARPYATQWKTLNIVSIVLIHYCLQLCSVRAALARPAVEVQLPQSLPKKVLLPRPACWPKFVPNLGKEQAKCCPFKMAVGQYPVPWLFTFKSHKPNKYRTVGMGSLNLPMSSLASGISPYQLVYPLFLFLIVPYSQPHY